MTCPNCSTDMEHQALEGQLGVDIELDLCFACHVLWFDKRESIQLAAGGTLRLFRVMNEHRDDPRHALADGPTCPRCSDRLKLVRDIGKGGRFSYYSCPQRHGRLTPFSEFLKEKQFVRELNQAEKHRMRAELRQVQCSGCGAPVDLAGGFACGHCGSPVTVLDADAVEKTLRDLDSAQAARAGDPLEKEARARALAAMETMRTVPDDNTRRLLSLGQPSTGLGTDLLTASLHALFGRF